MVDLHRYDRNIRSGGAAFDWLSSDDERPEFLKVRSMANLIGRGLRKPEMRYYNNSNPRQTIKLRRSSPGQELRELTRITNSEGEIARPSCDGKKRGGRGYLQGCFMCRRHQQLQQNTCWWCSGCKMPLCKVQRGEFTCYQEHLDNFDDPVLGCVPRARFKMPPDYRLYSLDDNQIYSNNHPKLPSFESTSFTDGPEMDEEAPMETTENGVNPGEKEINSAAEAPAEVAVAAVRAKTVPAEVAAATAKTVPAEVAAATTAITVMNKNSLRRSKRRKHNSNK